MYLARVAACYILILTDSLWISVVPMDIAKISTSMPDDSADAVSEPGAADASDSGMNFGISMLHPHLPSVLQESPRKSSKRAKTASTPTAT